MSRLGLELGWPAALWALALCPLLLLAVIRSRALLSRLNFVLITTLRLLVIVLVVLALADARLQWPNDELAVATIIDGSASISPAERQLLEGRVRWLTETRAEVDWLDLSPVVDPEHPATNDLGHRVAAARALLPRDRVRRIVVATDGRSDRASLLSAARRARDNGLRLDVLPIGESPAVDQISLSDLELPRLIRAGETASVAIEVTSRVEQRVTLNLTVDDHLVAQLPVTATAGRSRHEHQITLRDEGIHQIAARLVAADNALADNDSWTALVRVAPPPRVLLVREAVQPEPPLAAVLRDARLQVELVTPAQVARDRRGFNRYQLVVLDELDPSLLQEPQQRGLRQWVEEGGGLITITGTNAVRSEPSILREIEPVIPPRSIPETPPMEIILVIDRSGSMSGHRMAMARQAGVAAVQAMRPDSRVGLVAFSGSPDTIIPPVDMSRAQWLISIISSLTSGGGTDISGALNAAGSIVTNDPRYLHHIILLSDGVSSTQPALWEAQMLASRGVTISTISLGHRNNLMSDIAALGRGRYHVAHDPSQLPQLFVREARYRQAPPHRVVDFRPQVAETMAFLDGVDFSAAPELAGYVLAETRPEAQTVLRSDEGDTILAHWEVGEGQVASFTTATAGRWADRWRAGTSGSFRRLWSQMAWELLRERVEGELEMRVDDHQRDPEIRVITVATDDVEQAEAPVVDLARSRDPRGLKPLLLTQRGPGLWQVEVERGTGFLSSAAPDDGEDPVAAVAVDAPYPEELMVFGPDEAALAALAEAGGGQVLVALEHALAVDGEATITQRLRLPLLLAALVLYLLSVLLLRLPQNARAASRRR